MNEVEKDSVLMPRGKFAGIAIAELPSSYLRWVSENFKEDFIASLADAEYQWREKFNLHFEQEDMKISKSKGG